MNHFRNTLLVVLLWFVNFSVLQAQSSGKTFYRLVSPQYGTGANDFSSFICKQLEESEALKGKEIKGNYKAIVTIAKTNEIRAISVKDTSSNALFNRLAGDALKRSGIRWTAGKLNLKEMEMNVIVTIGSRMEKGSSTTGFYKAGYELAGDVMLSTCYYNEGVELAAKKEFSEAVLYLSEVLAIRPEDTDARYNRGVCYVQLNEKEKACSDWLEMKKQGSSDADAFIAKYCAASPAK